MSENENKIIDSFIEECENLENFQGIRNFSVVNSERDHVKFNFEKFKEGSKRVAEWHKQNYR